MGKNKWERKTISKPKKRKRVDPHIFDPKEIPEFNWKTPELEKFYNMNRRVINKIKSHISK